jgi:hypothetical protein
LSDDIPAWQPAPEPQKIPANEAERILREMFDRGRLDGYQRKAPIELGRRVGITTPDFFFADPEGDERGILRVSRRDERTRVLIGRVVRPADVAALANSPHDQMSTPGGHVPVSTRLARLLYSRAEAEPQSGSRSHARGREGTRRYDCGLGASEDELMREYKEIRRASREKKRDTK